MAKRKATTASSRKRKAKKKGDSDDRNEGPGDAGDAKAEAEEAQRTERTTPDPPIIDVDAAAVEALSRKLISAFYSPHGSGARAGGAPDHRLLEACHDDGTIERKLWPYFLHHAGGDGDGDGDGDWAASSGEAGPEAVAFALVVLANRRGGGGDPSSPSGGGAGDARLRFVVDDYDYAATRAGKDDGAAAATRAPLPPGRRTAAFAALLRRLLGYQDRAVEGARALRARAEATRFLISAYAAMELRCAPSGGPSGSAAGVPVLAGPLADLVGVRLWDAVPRRRRHLEMLRDGLLRKRYGLFEARRRGGGAGGGGGAGFLPGAVAGLLDCVASLGDGAAAAAEVGAEAPDDADGGGGGKDDPSRRLRRGYVSKILELLLDLLSYPQTRKHVAPYLSSQQLVVQLVLSKLYRQGDVLFRQQVDMLLESERTEAGGGGEEAGTGADPMIERAHILQKLLHRHHPASTSKVIFAGAGRVADGAWLRKRVAEWDEATLYDVCRSLRLVDDDDGGTAAAARRLGCARRDLLVAVLVYHQSSRASDAAVLAGAPLYPTEALLWDAHSLPPGRRLGGRRGDEGGGADTLSLPKLNTRFLSAGDYLLRNFRLFRLESAYGIRGDIVDAIRRMRPTLSGGAVSADAMVDYYGDIDPVEGGTEFHGWARMALQPGSKKKEKPALRLVRVDPPRLGEHVPSRVVAELCLDLHSCATSLAQEWDEIGEHDNLFLVSLDAAKMSGDPAPLMAGEHGHGKEKGKERRIPDEEDVSFPQRYGVCHVRGCVVLEVRDEQGTVLTDPSRAHVSGGPPEPKGKLRFLRVGLDPAQFAEDAQRGPGTELYDRFNLVVRRHGRENNFRSVLETVRGLMAGGAGSVYRSVPSWLLPVLLGYGEDPGAACHTSSRMRAFASETTGVTSPDAALDYGDTFMDEKHLRDSFPECRELVVDSSTMEMSAGAGATDKDGVGDPSQRKKYRIKVIEEKSGGQDCRVKVEATSYPFPPSYSGNSIRFTPVQVEAIRSGLSPGLTTIIGPPGTGKTDVAVQIIANLYHSFPTQRTVIVTHSNAALNDIFDKVMARGDVDERYMLRLGAGERNLTTTSASDHDFTKTGRVAHILSRRRDLLEKVQQLSEALGVSGKGERGSDGAPSYTCETAEYFYLHHVKKQLEGFQDAVAAGKCGDGPSSVKNPFQKYFSRDSPTSLTSAEASTKVDEIRAIFDELAEYRPFELLRSQRQRTNYLLTKQVRIVAMTCTHAAIARSHLVKVGFHYDNILMEEAGQMLDVETFVPLLLQRGESDDGSSGAAHSRLKRVCLIGDHNQLPPVVKNRTFSEFSRYDQSMFARLVRLGVPSIELNKQGRARPDIARLYSWRYDGLGDLDRVTRGNFKKANTGLAHTFQLINVEEFEGQGESSPTAYFYQNVGEAEYAVALFQYMVLLGYPPQKISILTTYNGQKDLLHDIVSQRCGEGTPLAGITPGAISTVDQYQGQQNDYIILSLVRTKAVGHLRDIRRLVVAVSRARLGLYIFCRQSLFCNCHELRPTMDQLVARPSKLQLVKGEHFSTQRTTTGKVKGKSLHEVNDVTELGALVHSMQQNFVK